jgi:hypothetical protein
MVPQIFEHMQHGVSILFDGTHHHEQCDHTIVLLLHLYLSRTFSRCLPQVCTKLSVCVCVLSQDVVIYIYGLKESAQDMFHKICLYMLRPPTHTSLFYFLKC